MKNKVLILINSSSGLYSFRKELIEALKKDAEVFASTPDSGKVDLINDMGCQLIDTEIDRRGSNPLRDLKLLCFYMKLLKDIHPDMVITYTIKPNIYGGLACRMLRFPYATNITGLGTAFQKKNTLRKIVTILYRISLKKAKCVFFENSANMELMIDENIVRREQAVLLSGAGVNLQHFALSTYPDTTKVRFLFVGRVMKEKGIDELFAAMERLHAEGESCCLDVLGGYEENYAQTIQRCEEQGWLHYHGYQKDVRPFIERAHCFVLPSYHEGMANTNLECAAMGRPLITSNIPGCKEAVVEGVSGLLCQPQDADSLYQAMKRFLAMSKEERAVMGLAGRRHMEDVFDKKKVVGETMKGLGL